MSQSPYDTGNWRQQPVEQKQAVVRNLQAANQQLILGIAEKVIQVANGVADQPVLTADQVAWTPYGVVRTTTGMPLPVSVDRRVQVAAEVADFATQVVAQRVGEQPHWQRGTEAGQGLSGQAFVEQAATNVAQCVLPSIGILVGRTLSDAEAFTGTYIKVGDPEYGLPGATARGVDPQLRRVFTTAVVAARDAYLNGHVAYRSTI